MLLLLCGHFDPCPPLFASHGHELSPLLSFAHIHTQFNLFANSIEAQLAHHIENLQQGMDNLGDTITVSANEEEDRDFPFVTVDRFEVHGEHALARTRMESLVYAPLVNGTAVSAWQDFSVQNQGWIEQSRATFLEHSDSRPVYLPGKVSPFIYRLVQGKFPRQVDPQQDAAISEGNRDNGFLYAPIWYLSPPPFNPAIVNFDLFSHHEYNALMQHVLANQKAAFSPVVDVERSLSLQVSDADHLEYHQQFIHVDVGVGYDRPHTTYLQPIFASRKSNQVAGVLFGVLAWDVYLAELLPDGVHGMMVVIHSSCGEDSTYTYELNGPTVSFL